MYSLHSGLYFTHIYPDYLAFNLFRRVSHVLEVSHEFSTYKFTIFTCKLKITNLGCIKTEGTITNFYANIRLRNDFFFFE